MYFSVMTTSKDLFCMLMLSLAIRNCEKNVLVLIYEKTKSVKKNTQSNTKNNNNNNQRYLTIDQGRRDHPCSE